MHTKFNIAVIGTGGMGTRHIKSWKAHGHNVISVVDTDRKRAKQAADTFNIPNWYVDYKQALSNPETDIVSVCTPLKFHAEVTIFAAEHGKHVFCEKPLCRNIKEAKAMEQAIRSSGINFGIGYHRSRTRDIELIGKWIDEKRFGTPLTIDINFRGNVKGKKAMHDAEGNMGPAMDMACHYYIMWQNILKSKVSKVFAKARVLAHDMPQLADIKKPAWDTVKAVMEYKSGVIASYNMCWGLEKNTTLKGNSHYIYGPNGGVEWEPQKIIVHQNGVKEEIQIIDPDEPTPEGVTGPHLKQYIPFVESIETGKPAPVGLQDGKDTLAVALALFESIDTEREVEVKYF